MLTRRKLLQFLPSLPFVGGFVGGSLLLGNEPVASTPLPDRDYFKEQARHPWRLPRRNRLHRRAGLTLARVFYCYRVRVFGVIALKH